MITHDVWWMTPRKGSRRCTSKFSVRRIEAVQEDCIPVIIGLAFLALLDIDCAMEAMALGDAQELYKLQA